MHTKPPAMCGITLGTEISHSYHSDQNGRNSASLGHSVPELAGLISAALLLLRQGPALRRGSTT